VSVIACFNSIITRVKCNQHPYIHPVKLLYVRKPEYVTYFGPPAPDYISIQPCIFPEPAGASYFGPAGPDKAINYWRYVELVFWCCEHLHSPI